MSKGIPWGLSGKEPLQKTRVQSLGWEDPLRKWQYSSILARNSMDRGAWWATVNEVTKRVGHDAATKQQHVQKFENRDSNR